MLESSESLGIAERPLHHGGTALLFPDVLSSQLNLAHEIKTNSSTYTSTTKMTSLKRDLNTDPHSSKISSKVYIRSTRNGKVQKIVRDIYLRQDIPCSSKLCSTCLENAPANASGNGRLEKT